MGLRMTLAALAALLALVFLAVWIAKGRQHSRKGRGVVLFYSLLLLASSAALFFRAKSENVRPQHQLEVESENRVSDPDLSQVVFDTTSTGEIAGKTSTKTKSESLGKEEAAIWTKSALELPRDVIGNDQSQSRNLGIRDGRNAPSLYTSDLQHSVEDVIESRILDAFDIIELFFETHGTKTFTSRPEQSKSSISSIEFVTGGAELSLRSVQYLRAFASELDKKYEHGVLEIHAQTDEAASSSEQRLQLTQSRAEAVRDVLIAHGFPAERLLSFGSEKAGTTRVKFVHRPN